MEQNWIYHVMRAAFDFPSVFESFASLRRSCTRRAESGPFFTFN